MVAPLGYKTSVDHPSKYEWRVHDGFQRVYRGIRHAAFNALKEAITSINREMENRATKDWDLVITAHSLGAAVSYLVLLDILHAGIGPDGLEHEAPMLPATTRITIATFGSPRVGNPALVRHFRESIHEWRQMRGSEDALTEWAIIGHMDGGLYSSGKLGLLNFLTGVPALPPTFFGYAHFSAHPLYSFGGHLYLIPSDQCEYTYFKVDSPKDEPVMFARGGHNYYGARDMERLQRRMKAIFLDITPKPQAAFLQNVPPRPRTRSHRSISEAAGRFKNKRLQELSERPKSRASSLPGGGSESPSTSDPQEDADDLESSIPPPNVPLDSTSEHPWIRQYLEREKEEEELWARRNHPQSIWGTMRGVVSFGFSK